jgi:ribonuclease P protein component
LPLLQPSIKTLNGFGAFTRVITRGKKFDRKPIKAFVYSSPSKDTELRVGFAVSKVIRKATQRNLLKRLMKEAFRARKEDFFGHVSSGMRLEIVFLYNGDLTIPPKKVRLASIGQSLTDLSSTMKSYPK